MQESSLIGTLTQIRSFVRREARITPAQIRALETLWPQYGLDSTIGYIDSDNYILEIGFGGGESLLTMAIANPQTNFIGVEVHRPGVGSLLAALAKHQLNNVILFREDAVTVLNKCIRDSSLNRIHIFFPDPWPKKRHHKRRLIQIDFMGLVQKKLKTGGYLHLATDWADYAKQMLQVINETKSFTNCGEEGGYLFNQTLRPLTKFEKRGRELGHSIWDILIKKI